jgi:hypothetical protein
MIPKRTANRRTVKEDLHNWRWIEDIQGVATMDMLHEFLRLWDMVECINLQQDMHDLHIWRLSSSGQYTAKSAYGALCQGSIRLDPEENLENLGPRKVPILPMAGNS